MSKKVKMGKARKRKIRNKRRFNDLRIRMHDHGITNFGITSDFFYAKREEE